MMIEITERQMQNLCDIYGIEILEFVVVVATEPERYFMGFEG